MNSVNFFKNRKARRERVLRKMAAMRAAKTRKRQALLESGVLAEWTDPPAGSRYYPFEFGIRIKATGETHFTDLRSVRHASTALGLILKYYQP